MGYPLTPIPSNRREQAILSVREARSWLDRRELAGLPWRICRGDRYWIPPSRSDRRRSFSPRHNPILAAERFAFFLVAARNVGLLDEIVGGIAVWLASGDDEEEIVAHFGGFDVTNDLDAAEALIEAAEVWLLERYPVAAIRGPYPLDARLVPGLLTDGYNVRMPACLPYNPPYYPEMVERAGYEPCLGAHALALPASVADPPDARVRIIAPQQNTDSWDKLQMLHDEETPGAAFGLILEEAGQVAGGLVMAPITGRGWLRDRFTSRKEAQLWARPAVVSPVVDEAGRLTALYSAAQHAAAKMGYAQVVIAPVSTEDETHLSALSTAGARPVQTYQVYEKRF